MSTPTTTYSRHTAALRLAELAEAKDSHVKDNRKQLAKDARNDTAEWLAMSARTIGALEIEAEQYRQFGDLLTEGNPIDRLIREAAEQAALGRRSPDGSRRPDGPGERHGLARAATEIIDVLTRIEQPR